MWPRKVSQVIRTLADLQRYDILWHFVLKGYFPESAGFSVKALEEPRTLLVCHSDHSHPVLWLTWWSPSKRRYLESDPFRRRRRSIPFITTADIYRVHCEGTVLDLYTLHSSVHRDKLRYGRRTSFDERDHDVDLMEPFGQERLLEHVRTAKAALNLPVKLMVEIAFPILVPFAEAKLKQAQPDAFQSLRIPSVSHPKPRTTIFRPLHGQGSSRSLLHLPVEIILLLTDNLGLADLRNFSLSHSSCLALVERRLWKGFTIVDSSSNAGTHVLKRLRAILRAPSRAKHTERLTIGPCTWAWTESHVHFLQEAWKLLPRLRILVLQPPPTVAEIGGEFAPVFRTLLKSGQHLRLEVFKYDGWIGDDGSLVYQVLKAHPTINQLVGVDSGSIRTATQCSHVLSQLEVLVCDFPQLPLALLPGSQLRILDMRWITKDDDLTQLFEAISGTSLVELRLSFGNCNVPRTSLLINQLAVAELSIRSLTLEYAADFEQTIHAVRRLKFLEQLTLSLVGVIPAPQEHLASCSRLLASSENLTSIMVLEERLVASRLWYDPTASTWKLLQIDPATVYSELDRYRHLPKSRAPSTH